MITFECTQCGQKYNVQDEYAGKKVRCKSCQAVNTIPSAGGSQKTSHSCDDSIAAYNNLLQELLRQEKQSPAISAE